MGSKKKAGNVSGKGKVKGYRRETERKVGGREKGVSVKRERGRV